MSDDRSAALLLRVWLDDGADTFRARLMEVTPDAAEPARTVATVSSRGDVLAAVRAWLDVRAPSELDPAGDRT